MNYAIVDEFGELLKVVSGTPDLIELNTPEGCVAVEPPPAPFSYWNGTEWVSKGSAPFGSSWNKVTKAWEDMRPIDLVRAEKWTEVKVERTRRTELPLVVNSYTFDATAYSQTQIAGAVTLAMLAPSDWTLDWTLADNSVATLTKAEVIEVGVALGARTSAIFAEARTLRTAIDAATTTAEVAAVQWSS